jgi:hypothetical protein
MSTSNYQGVRPVQGKANMSWHANAQGSPTCAPSKHIPTPGGFTRASHPTSNASVPWPQHPRRNPTKPATCLQHLAAVEARQRSSIHLGDAAQRLNADTSLPWNT